MKPIQGFDGPTLFNGKVNKVHFRNLVRYFATCFSIEEFNQWPRLFVCNSQIFGISYSASPWIAFPG
jgi:hypothetical protein